MSTDNFVKTYDDCLSEDTCNEYIKQFELAKAASITEEHVPNVSAASSAGADAATCRCTGADVQPYRFDAATSFNQDISVWDTSSVVTMNGM